MTHEADVERVIHPLQRTAWQFLGRCALGLLAAWILLTMQQSLWPPEDRQ